jgi:transposase InsO family protein
LEAAMPWAETSVLEQRMRFVAAALMPGANRRAVCRAFGISPKTGYKWLARFAAGGAVDGLQEQSRRPHRSPRQTPASLEQAVVAVRHEFGWAGRKLQSVLAARGYHVAPATIDRIIRRRGLTDVDERHRPALHRFEAPHPNALWQMDFKGQYPVREGWTFPLSVLDDHSRFAVGLAALSSTAGPPVQRVLQTCFEQYGVPDAILCDHGVPWWHAVAGHGLTRVSVFLLEQDIRVIHGGIAHPQTQGKVERFHRTLARRLRQWGVPASHRDFPSTLARFRDEYNEIRPHAALHERPPASCYQRSVRAFQRDPTPWRYPADQLVLRVNANGEIHYDRRRFFVSDALATKYVGCYPLGARLLVRFRDYPVRDIDLHTGRTRSLLSNRVSPMS